MDAIKDFSTGKVLFKALSRNEHNSYTSYELGNGLITNKAYNQFGAPISDVTGTIIDFSYGFNQENGNLNSRTDHITGLTEEFTYDNTNRLTKYQTHSISGANPETVVNYFPNGNIKEKTDIGVYAYDVNKINAVTEIVPYASKEPISLMQQDITYTPFNKIATVTEGDYEQTFTYGYGQERIKSELKEQGNLVCTKYYGINYEKEIKQGVTREIHYIPCGENNILYVIENGFGSYYYAYKDHLGSVLKLVDNVGTVIHEQSFDAWGRKRNPLDWSYDNIQQTPSWLRGYTGHEHMDEFELINMNGRLYDYKIGRMLSPDNYVQDPNFSQNYNRYSYVLNNPLKFTDPSGELALTTAALVYYGFKYLTPVGYAIQKNHSFLAINFAYHPFWNTHKHGISLDVSIGIPRKYGISYRKELGVSLYSKNGEIGSGWETRSGGEWTFGPYTAGGTRYRNQNSEFNQTTGYAEVNIGRFRAQYENDFAAGIVQNLPWKPNSDGGDRFRTGAARISVGRFNVGFNIFTGDNGAFKQRQTVGGDGGDDAPNNDDGTYITSLAGDDPDKYRLGALYFGFDNLRIGIDSEKYVRHNIQNRLIHDNTGAAHFRKTRQKTKFYFQFSTANEKLW